MESYSIAGATKNQFTDFSDVVIPDSELASFYKQEILELQRQYKRSRNIGLKLDIKKQIIFFEEGIKYLEKIYGKKD